MKRLYSSGGQKGADNSRLSRRIEAAIVGRPTSFINSFFKTQDSQDSTYSSADIPLAAAVVENTDTAEEEPNVSPVCQGRPPP